MRRVLALMVVGLAGAWTGAHAQDAGAPLNLSLSCGGTAIGTQQQFASGQFNSTNNFGGSSSTNGSITLDHQVEYDGRVRIHISGDQGTINVPSRMMPPMRGKRDADGAFKLTSVTVTERTITGQFSFNFINKPKFVIDRATGDIEMSGFQNGFSGTCERVADQSAARKF